MDRPRGDALVGRDEALARVAASVASARAGRRTGLLVTGSAGIGKTALLRAALSGARGVDVAWGTCVGGGSAPGYWPWTQALNGLVRAVGGDRARGAAGADAALVSGIVSALGDHGQSEPSERGRMLLLDATAAWVTRLATLRPVVLVLDDVHWMDESSLALLELVLQDLRPAPLCVLAAFRHDDGSGLPQARLASLVARADHVHLTGLDRAATGRLVHQLVGAAVSDDAVDALFRRAGGHPFFTRELAFATASGTPTDRVPAAVQDAVERRVAALSAAAQDVLQAAALTGPVLLPDVLSAMTAHPPDVVAAATAEAVAAGVLVRGDVTLRFAHDLFREALIDRIEAQQRPSLHLAAARALEQRHARGGDVAAAEIARHHLQAVALAGVHDAVVWALRAASADRAALALADAAARLRGLRAAVADAGLAMDDADFVDVLLAEADLLARTGRPSDARGLVRAARTAADRRQDPGRITEAALAVAAVGSRFATRRDDVVAELESALQAVGSGDAALEARLTAALARELQHSVPEQRARAGPLSERALERGRTVHDEDVLAACLLARHDVLWTPGQAAARAVVAAELVELAQAAGDPERHAEALLLQANALLESGSAAFAPALEQCLGLLEDLGQPRHLYTAQTRRACVALMRGNVTEAAARIDAAVELGRRLREPDTENVRMSQRLELVRARGDARELREFATQAVAHWTGAPVHAHAVAAGFCARAGDLDDARHHTAAVAGLGTWRADRSYLWSVFIRELAFAAVALEDRRLCNELLEELTPLADSCGVNGAVVAFAGSHAQTAAVLAAAVGREALARDLREQAHAVYERLGVAAVAEVGPAAGPSLSAGAALRRRGAVWEVTFAGRTASLAHAKGLADIARLVAQPGSDVHVLDLTASRVRSAAGGDVLDRTAVSDYRRRLTELSEDRLAAQAAGDAARLQALDEEHDALVTELQRTAGAGGRPRQFANHPSERARKAVAGRVRDALRRLADVLPEAAAHLERHIVTGVHCRYRGELRWQVEL